MFTLYRDAGPLERSIRKVAALSGRSVDGVEQLSRRHAWVARAAAWDAETDRIKYSTHVREIDALARREVLAGRLFQNKGLERIQGLADKDVAALTIGEAIRLTVVGARMEREGLGVLDLGLGDLPPPPETSTADLGPHATIVEVLRRHPSRVGPVVTALSSLMDALAGFELSDTSPAEDVEADTPDLRAGRAETVCRDPSRPVVDPVSHPPAWPSPWMLGVSARRPDRGRRRRSTVLGSRSR